jgi:hypothetical protein
MTDRLSALGDELERAARADRRRSTRRRRRVFGGAISLAILLPGAAVAANLLTEEDVARSLPQGTHFLVGTQPTCEEVKPDVEYRCTIKGAFESEIDGSLEGTVEPTVDASKHVNGGCRSVRADGREWRCYIGKAAVEQQIIGPDFLGAYEPTPGVG